MRTHLRIDTAFLVLSVFAAAPCFVRAADESTVAGGQKVAQQPEKEGHATKHDLERRKTDKTQLGSITVVDQRAAVFFEDRVEFFSLPPEISAAPEGFAKGAQKINPLELEPSKILWFTYRMQGRWKRGSKNLLLCAAAYLPKLQPSGLGDFCGVIAVDGSIVYQFPVKQHSPDTLLSPLAFSEDGNYAEVFVGRLVPTEDNPEIAEPREVLAWRYPNKLTRFPGPWHDGKPKDGNKAFDDLQQGFKTRKNPR